MTRVCSAEMTHPNRDRRRLERGGTDPAPRVARTNRWRAPTTASPEPLARANNREAPTAATPKERATRPRARTAREDRAPTPSSTTTEPPAMPTPASTDRRGGWTRFSSGDARLGERAFVRPGRQGSLAALALRGLDSGLTAAGS